MKTLFSLFFIVLAFNSINTEEPERSGVKIQLDTNIARFIRTVPFNQLLANKPLIDSPYKTNGKLIFDYEFEVSNLTVTNIVNPSRIDTSSDEEDGVRNMRAVFKNFQIQILTSYSLKYGPLHEAAENSLITVTIDELSGKVSFKDNKFIFNKFDVKIGKVDIKFNSQFLKVLYNLFRRLIVSQISGQVGKLNSIIELAVNNFMNNEFIYKTPVGGVAVNLTNIDKPRLIDTGLDLLKSLKFLQEENNSTLTRTNAVLQFGLNGSVYGIADQGPHTHTKDLPLMTFSNDTYYNPVTVLLSDYTLNTVLHFLHNMGALDITFDTKNNHNLTIPLTVDGLSQFLPELKTKYDLTKAMKLRFTVFAADNLDPEITTANSQLNLKLNFITEFLVLNGTHSWDKANTELKLDVTGTFPIKIFSDIQLLNIEVGDFKVEKIDVKENQLGTDISKLNDSIVRLINQVANSQKELLSNINIVDKINDSLGTNFVTIYADHEHNGYTEIGIKVRC